MSVPACDLVPGDVLVVGGGYLAITKPWPAMLRGAREIFDRMANNLEFDAG